MNKRYHARVDEAKRFLGGKCVKCGSKEDLQIDHIEPQLKKFTLTSLSWSCPLPKFYEELSKCQLLCYPCHKIKTREERGYTAGNTLVEFICDYCKNPFTRTYKKVGPKIRNGQKNFYCSRYCTGKFSGFMKKHSSVVQG